MHLEVAGFSSWYCLCLLLEWGWESISGLHKLNEIQNGAIEGIQGLSQHLLDKLVVSTR